MHVLRVMYDLFVLPCETPREVLTGAIVTIVVG